MVMMMSLSFTGTQLGFSLKGSGTVTINWGGGNGSQTETVVLSLTVFKSLKHAYQKGTYTITITIPTNGIVTHLSCFDNSLTALNVNNNSALTELLCYNNKLTSLNVNGLNKLQTLNCRNNSLNAQALDNLFKTLNSATDLSSNKNLYILDNLGVSGCTVKTALDKGWTVDSAPVVKSILNTTLNSSILKSTVSSSVLNSPINVASTTVVTGVSLNKTALTLNVNSSETLVASVVPSTAVNKNVTWSSNTPTRASVDAKGKVTIPVSASAGTAVITVTTIDGAKTATCTVTVTKPAPIDEPILNKNPLTDSKILSGDIQKEITDSSKLTVETDRAVSLIPPGMILTGISSPKVSEWTIGNLLNDRRTSHRPALAVYKDKLYMAWKGMTGDESIWFSCFDGNDWPFPKQVTYTENAKTRSCLTSCGPALAVYKDKLYMAWKGMTGDESIWYSCFNGSIWSVQQQVKSGPTIFKTSHGPALAVYKDELYLAWKGMGNDPDICYSCFNGIQWTMQRQVKSGPTIFKTSHGPALAVYRGKFTVDNDKLYMAWKGVPGDEHIWYSCFNGTQWTMQQSVPGALTSCGPALATYSKYWEHAKSYDPYYKDLYMVWKGSDTGNNNGNNTQIWQTIWYKVKVTPNTESSDVITCDSGLGEGWQSPKLTSAANNTSDTPALVVFNGKLYMAWKKQDEEKIFLSHLETGSDNPVRNIFEKTRPGKPVVRPEDLVVLRVETQNMKIVSGVGSNSKPRLQKKDNNPAYIILHFPPQSFAEQTFFQKRQEKLNEPDLTDLQMPSYQQNSPKLDPDDPKLDDDLSRPVCARIAHESRLVFIVPNNFEPIEYSLAGVLRACCTLDLKVSAAAGYGASPPVADFDLVSLNSLKNKNMPMISSLPVAMIDETLPLKRRVALASSVVRTMRIASTGDMATISTSQLLFEASFSSTATALGTTTKGSYDKVDVTPDFSDSWISMFKPGPQLPDATTTSIEMPWRLIMSPHKGGRWRHISMPVSSVRGHTELWHSRLVTPHNGTVIQPPYPDTERTTRAIWALSGIGKEIATNSNSVPIPMQSKWPDSANLPSTTPPNPFLTTLDNFDRYQFVHLSSNFNRSGYKPEPIETNMLMLSSLGGWLDSRGVWDPSNVGFSVEEWVHRATMGRDHYVRVVYRGFLFPFGHRVSLIKVSERKFHGKEPGNAAYLRQRMFIVVREKERTFVDNKFKEVKDNAGNFLYRKFPFTCVKLLTETTPDLDNPNAPHPHSLKGQGQKLFWPHVNNKPFYFQCMATDLDGRSVLFNLPMIFMDNTLASPRKNIGNGTDEKWVPHYENENTTDKDKNGAYAYAKAAMDAYAGIGQYPNDWSGYNTASLNCQRVALAPSLKSGDTSVQVKTMKFGGFVEYKNDSLKTYSDDLQRPIWVPQVEDIEAWIESITHLSGEQKTHKLKFNKRYLQVGFNHEAIIDGAEVKCNKGEVFVNIQPGGPTLDFSSQGDKSGGFIKPNINPVVLSRIAGPVMGKHPVGDADVDADVLAFIEGTMVEGAGFPKVNSSSLPMPLLFGCIPLGELIKSVDIVECPECVPKFISETGSAVESFINDLIRLHTFVTDLPSQSVGIVIAALNGFKDTLDDLKEQANICTYAQKSAVQPKVTDTLTGIDNLINAIRNHSNVPSGIVSNLKTILINFGTAANVPYETVFLPAGLRQSILNTVQKIDTLLDQISELQSLLTSGNALQDALINIVDPKKLYTLLAKPADLAFQLKTLQTAINPFCTKLDTADFLDGAPRNTIRTALNAVVDIIGESEDSLANLVNMLIGDELTIRFDWNPKIKNWKNDDKPLFRVHDEKGLLVAVEAKVKRNGSGSKISVNCSLKHFDLVLIAPKSFIELNFEKVEFSVDSEAKMDVDVRLSDIKFVGVLSFVETLRDLIPLDGFSDPPYLDITKKGIDAGYSISLPSITCGMLNIANVSLGAGFTVPFIGQPLGVRFNFCSREKPFLLTVYVFGGGGFFGITISPDGVQVLDAALEFGAAIVIDFGVASGSVCVMAGLYFRMEDGTASLTGYFRLNGNVNVLGLINASIELYLGLTYDPGSGKCAGDAHLTIGVSVAFFSTHVTLHCRREFAGSNGDPTLRQMLGYKPELTLTQELEAIKADGDKARYAWREYLEAFAKEAT